MNDNLPFSQQNMYQDSIAKNNNMLDLNAVFCQTKMNRFETK